MTVSPFANPGERRPNITRGSMRTRSQHTLEAPWTRGTLVTIARFGPMQVQRRRKEVTRRAGAAFQQRFSLATCGRFLKFRCGKRSFQFDVVGADEECTLHRQEGQSSYQRILDAFLAVLPPLTVAVMVS